VACGSSFIRLPGEGRLPTAGVPSGRLPTSGAGLPAAGVPSAGLPAAVRAAAAPAAAAEQRPFLHGGMVRSSSSHLLCFPLCSGRLLCPDTLIRCIHLTFSTSTSRLDRICTACLEVYIAAPLGSLARSSRGRRRRAFPAGSRGRWARDLTRELPPGKDSHQPRCPGDVSVAAWKPTHVVHAARWRPIREGRLGFNYSFVSHAFGLARLRKKYYLRSCVAVSVKAWEFQVPSERGHPG
jgi:hypothetical protein